MITGIFIPQRGRKRIMKYIKKSFRYDDKRYYVYGNSETDAIKKMALKKNALEHQQLINVTNRTVDSWTKECIEVYKLRFPKRL